MIEPAVHFLTTFNYTDSDVTHFTIAYDKEDKKKRQTCVVAVRLDKGLKALLIPAIDNETNTKIVFDR